MSLFASAGDPRCLCGQRWSDSAFTARGGETAQQWWDALSAEPRVAPLLAERARRFAGTQRQQNAAGL
jgi:hypothetical protein